MSVTYSETLSDYSLLAELKDKVLEIHGAVGRAISNGVKPEIIREEKERLSLLEDDIARIESSGTDWLAEEQEEDLLEDDWLTY
jgi:hypothetical protein